MLLLILYVDVMSEVFKRCGDDVRENYRANAPRQVCKIVKRVCAYTKYTHRYMIGTTTNIMIQYQRRKLLTILGQAVSNAQAKRATWLTRGRKQRKSRRNFRLRHHHWWRKGRITYIREENGNIQQQQRPQPKKDSDGTMILDCFTTKTEHKRQSRTGGLRTRFDTDSIAIKVDNCASASMSPHIEDFIDAPIRCKNVRIKGFTATSSEVYKGTIQWVIEDDRGQTHKIVLPNSYYVPQGNQRLLCP
jgi:hypothetical protein